MGEAVVFIESKMPPTKAYPRAILFPRPVLTANRAGAQQASANTFVLSPPATSSLWHNTGYPVCARLEPSSVQSIVGGDNVFGADILVQGHTCLDVFAGR